MEHVLCVHVVAKDADSRVRTVLLGGPAVFGPTCNEHHVHTRCFHCLVEATGICPRLTTSLLVVSTLLVHQFLRKDATYAALAPTHYTFEASLKNVKAMKPAVYDYITKVPLASWAYHAGKQNRT